MSFEQKQYWLKGQEYERERIIKLLEGQIRECECGLVGMRYCRHKTAVVPELVTLIKGEELMTDYTPTTEEVRDAFSDYKEDDAGGWYEAEAQFYRWLAEVKAEAWEEGQLALLEYMGVPLYPSKGDEPRNPKQPRNPYRQGENSKCLICDTPKQISWN